MKAQHLRIGNLLKYCDDGSIFTVDGIHEYGIDCHDDVENSYMEYENFEPIPLTEEWLFKFGFENDDDDFLKDIDERTGIHISLKTGRYLLEGYDGVIKIPCEIKYVHELQNLYYALTKKELTL